MSSSLMFNRVYRLEIQPVMLVYSTPLVNYCPSTFSLISPTPPLFPKYRIYCIIQTVCGCGGGGGVLSCLQTIFYRSLTLCFWPYSEPPKLLHPPPPTKTPVETTFRDWCLHSSFVHDFRPSPRRSPTSRFRRSWGWGSTLMIKPWQAVNYLCSIST